MKFGIAGILAVMTALLVALVVRERGQRAVDEAELWAEAADLAVDDSAGTTPVA